MLVILLPTPAIVVATILEATKILVVLFHNKLGDCMGGLVPLPTINWLGWRIFNPVPPLLTNRVPSVI